MNQSSSAFIWQQTFSKTYQEGVELLLILVFSPEELKKMVTYDFSHIRLADCYQRVTHYICTSADTSQTLDRLLRVKLESEFIKYCEKSPIELCSLMSRKENSVRCYDLLALYWCLLRKGSQCPTKLYQYAYQRYRYLACRRFLCT